MGFDLEPEPGEIPRTARRCPKCDAHEPDLSVRSCRNCGELLLEMLRNSKCPGCGAASEEREVCLRCGTSVVIGPPLSECYPQKPFSAGMKPVILLREGLAGPPEGHGGTPAGRFEELEASAAHPAMISGINLTVDPNQMSGTPQDHVKLAVGETVTVYARGLDADGKWCPLPPGLAVKWRADRELAISPRTGDMVTAHLLSAPKVSAMATARTVVDKKKLQRLFTVEKK